MDFEEIIKELDKIKDEEPLPANSHWKGEYMKKKAEQIREATNA